MRTSCPSIRNLIVGDLHAALRGDPAATSIAEVLLCYRGTIAIIYHRIAHAIYMLGGRFLARLFSDIAHARTGIDIHPAARIGEGFFIDHGTGVVIGETAIIGNSVRLYQAVTLGARSFPVDEAGNLIKGEPRHPIIEDNVVIYSGATVLGRVTVGRDSVIGGNVWLTRSVPPGSVITQASLRALPIHKTGEGDAAVCQPRQGMCIRRPSRNDRRSSPWSRRRRSPLRIFPWNRRTHRLRRWRGAGNANRRRDRRACRSTWVCLFSVAPFIHAFRSGERAPLGVHAEQIEEEVVGEFLRLLGQEAVLGCADIAAEHAQAAEKHRHLRRS